MKFALLIFVFIQAGLDVTIDTVSIQGRFIEREVCVAKAQAETKVLPLEVVNDIQTDARWQYATCIQVQ
ncbi:MAG: hypothetical protein ABWX90_03610 [Candidatus Saccharimonadales bacterium]